jgi:hypothetical protein
VTAPLPAEDGTDPADRPTPPPDEDVPGLRTAGLRTLAASVDPDPIVTLSGTDLSTTADGPGPIALDALSVSWGREAAMDQPGAATATVRLFDPTGVWATGRELIGQPLLLSWTATYPGETSPRRKAFFRGRVTAAKLSRRSVSNTATGGTVTGTEVELGASSLLTDLANRVPFEAWPDETLEARRARVATWASGPVASVTVRDYWKPPHVAPVAAADQPSVLDSLLGLYDSAGPDRMVYDPDAQTVDWLNRRNYGNTGLGQLWWKVAGEGTAMEGRGAYATVRTTTANADNKATNRHHLDGAFLEAAEGLLSKDISSRVTRVEVAHKDSGAAFAARVETALVAGTDEGSQGVRAIRHDSQVTWNDYALHAAQDLAGMAGAEAAGWSTGSLTYRADLAGGFEYFDQFAEILLSGMEANSPVFIQRAWFTGLGIRPHMVIVGGTIAYEGGWRSTIDIQPTSSIPGVAQHAISWSEIDDGSTTYELQWHDEDHPRGLMESLTYEDIGFVARGLGVTTAPTNPDWDQVYSL